MPIRRGDGRADLILELTYMNIHEIVIVRSRIPLRLFRAWRRCVFLSTIFGVSAKTASPAVLAADVPVPECQRGFSSGVRVSRAFEVERSDNQLTTTFTILQAFVQVGQNS